MLSKLRDNALVCKAACLIVAIYLCLVHTFNLVLQNICATENTETNEIVYDECYWATYVVRDAFIIRNFIVNHSMKLEFVI